MHGNWIVSIIRCYTGHLCDSWSQIKFLPELVINLIQISFFSFFFRAWNIYSNSFVWPVSKFHSEFSQFPWSWNSLLFTSLYKSNILTLWILLLKFFQVGFLSHFLNLTSPNTFPQTSSTRFYSKFFLPSFIESNFKFLDKKKKFKINFEYTFSFRIFSSFSNFSTRKKRSNAKESNLLARQLATRKIRFTAWPRIKQRKVHFDANRLWLSMHRVVS